MRNDNEKGAISRRNLVLAAAGAIPIIAFTSTGAKAGKMAQTAVAYQDTPKDGKQCDGCNLFVAPNSCKTVDGTISPTGWCRIWVKKA